MDVKFFNKQILFKSYNELEEAQNEFKETLETIIPEGTKVDIQRGNGIWKNIEVVGCDGGRHAGYFRGRTSTGKIMSFYWKDIK